MTNLERFDVIEETLMNIQHRIGCYNGERYCGCRGDCHYMAYDGVGDSYCTIDAMLDDVYKELELYNN